MHPLKDVKCEIFEINVCIDSKNIYMEHTDDYYD